MPCFSLVFGELLNSFNKPMASMLASVTTFALGFIWIGIGTFLASWGSIAIFMMVGERQTRAIRQNYLRAILRQVCLHFYSCLRFADFRVP